MVSGVKWKKSKAKHFQSHHPSCPRDIWEFLAKSSERVYNTKTGALLKDVLDYQTLTPRKAEQMQREYEFPKTIFPVIDPARLKVRAVSVDPDVAEARLKAEQRHAFLAEHCAGGAPKGQKGNGLGPMKGHFNVAGMENMISQYKKTRPAWLQPKHKEVHREEKKKEFDPRRGISKAEQEEMLTAAVFEDAKNQSNRAQALRQQFHYNLKEGQLLRVQNDLALNRVFFKPELEKRSDLHSHFARKMVDRNLDIRVIEAASPTKFFEMVHRRLNPANYRPETYHNIYESLIPEPTEEGPPPLETSPYLTYVCPPGGKFVPRAGDEDRWGRRSVQDVFNLVEKDGVVVKDTGLQLGLPKGMGRTFSHTTKGKVASPWLGGGPGPSLLAQTKQLTMTQQNASPAPSPSPTLHKKESSTFITQASNIAL